jgi:hypothetical protein
MPSGTSYEGMYVADKREGYGVIKLKNGNVEKGFWKKGQ